MARELGVHAETIRRYAKDGPPCLPFLLGLQRCGYSVDWLVSGVHDARLERRPKPLKDVPTEALLAEVSRRFGGSAGHITAVLARVSEVERRLNALERVKPREGRMVELKLVGKSSSLAGRKTPAPSR